MLLANARPNFIDPDHQDIGAEASREPNAGVRQAAVGSPTHNARATHHAGSA